MPIISGNGQNFSGSLDDASSMAGAQSYGDSQQSVTSSAQRGKRVAPKPKVPSPDPQQLVNPEQFIGHIVFRESNEHIILGTVHYYDRDVNMFYAEYDNGVGLFVKMDDLFNQLATDKEINEASDDRLLAEQQKENDDVEKPKLKPKGKSSTNKKAVTKKATAKGKAIATPPAPRPFNPEDYIRRVIFKQHNGKTTLGSVHYYDPDKDLFYVEFEDRDKKFVEKEELFKICATTREICLAQGATTPSSPKGEKSKAGAEKKKRGPPAGETSSAPKKKRNASTGPKK